ncbi:MAG TPA: DUF2087 domain-containing protein [Vicinamibacteria bacterium]
MKRHHPDTAALRRALVDHRFMAREGGGGAYWRTPEAADLGAAATARADARAIGG